MNIYNILIEGALLLVSLNEIANRRRGLIHRLGICLVVVCAASQELLEIKFLPSNLDRQAALLPGFYLEQLGLLLLLLQRQITSKLRLPGFS